MVDISRETSGIVLPKSVTGEIFANMEGASVVQSLARKVDLPGPGITIPVITGDPEAEWVGETDEAPVSRPSFGSKNLTPYKLSVIVPFSNEFKRDKAALFAQCTRRLPAALARKFDATVFAASGAPGADFAQLGGAEAVALAPHATDVKKGTYAGLVEAFDKVADADGELNGWALNSKGKSLMLGQVDTTGRPLLAESIANGSSVATLLGERVVYGKGVTGSGVLGFAGDWSTAVWGAVEDITISISNDATITDGTKTIEVGEDTIELPNTLNLFQRGMFAVKAEVEIGFTVRDVANFVKLTNSVRS